MKTTAVALLAAVLLLLPQGAVAGERAAIVNYGKRSIPGVETTAGAYRPPVQTSTVSAPEVGRTASVELTVAENWVVPTNRCTATNLGQGFSYSFANGVECASFSAPVPGEPVRRNGRKPRPPSAAQIAAALFDRTIALAPEPQLEVAPSRIGLTGLRTFVWLDESPRPIVATASAGATTVTAVATPARFVWDFGEGQVRSTSDAGTRWTPRQRGSVGHMYQASGRYDLSVDVLWSAQWRSGTGPWQPLGTFSTSDSRPYLVREVIAWLARRR